MVSLGHFFHYSSSYVKTESSLSLPFSSGTTMNVPKSSLVKKCIEKVQKNENPLVDLFKLVPQYSDYYDAVLNYNEDGDPDVFVALPDLINELMKVRKLTPEMLNASYQDGGGDEILGGSVLGMVLVYTASAQVDLEEFVLKLIENGADVKRKTSRGGAQSFLHALLENNDFTFTAKARIAKILVDNGADVNETDCGISLLQYCIHDHNPDFLQVLLEAGADATVRFDDDGIYITDTDTAISYTFKRFLKYHSWNAIDTILTMLKLFVDVAGCDINKVIDDDGNTAFHGLLKWYSVDTPWELIVDDRARNCMVALVDYFIEAGDAALKNKNGETVLHLAAADSFLDSVVKRLTIKCPNLIKMKDNDGRTPLTVALDKEAIKNVFVLLRPLSLYPEKWSE
jgi:ankyrin repeat protein